MDAKHEMDAMINSSWPPHDVVAKLVEATGILLDDHDYDGQGHEAIRIAQRRAERWLAEQPEIIETLFVDQNCNVTFVKPEAG
jgi:hypothetical protein